MMLYDIVEAVRHGWLHPKLWIFLSLSEEPREIKRSFTEIKTLRETPVSSLLLLCCNPNKKQAYQFTSINQPELDLDKPAKTISDPYKIYAFGQMCNVNGVSHAC